MLADSQSVVQLHRQCIQSPESNQGRIQVRVMQTEMEGIRTAGLQLELMMQGVLAKCKLLENKMKEMVSEESTETLKEMNMSRMNTCRFLKR